MRVKRKICVYLSDSPDRRRIDACLRSLGHDVVARPPGGEARADLFILDAAAARREGQRVLSLKDSTATYLPVLIALAEGDDFDPWLEAGYDHCIRLPVDEDELRADITAFLRMRQLFEELVRRGEARYRAVFESTGTATLVVDADTTILLANDECLPVTGYSPSELVGTRWTEYVAPECLDMMLKHHAARRKEPDKIPRKYETRLVDKAGEVRDVILYVNMIPGTEQSVVSMLDITDRKRAEERLRTLSSVVEQTTEGMATADLEGNLTFVNRAWLAMHGYDPDEDLTGRNLRIFHSPEQMSRDVIPFNREVMESGANTGEVGHMRKDGTTFPTLMTTTLLRDDRGEPVALAGICKDISDRVRLEQEKEHLEHQLMQAQKAEAIGRLAGGIAHDFNNMLSIILGYADDILDHVRAGDPIREQTEEIMKAGQRSAALIRQLLAFSRRQTLQPEVLNVNTVIRNIESLLTRLVGEDVELELPLQEGLDHVKVDPSQLEQVVMNLVANARDAMPNGGRLTIETANVELDEVYARRHADVVPGRYVMLAFSDTGVGMDKETSSRVFEPFFTTKEEKRGTGLGLSTVFGIVKQSGGNIWVYSEPGKGTTFKIYLPVTQEQPAKKAARSKPSERERRGEHILVVEDEAPLRNLFEKLLLKFGYRVTVAANGEEALMLVEAAKLNPDLVITDVVMPGMGGAALVERLRSTRPDLKVLYTSGYTDNTIVHHGVLDPDTPLIQKPFNMNELARKVDEVIQGSGGTRR